MENNLKHLLLPVLLTGLLAALPASAQEIEYGIDESCGCEIVFIDGIQTTSENGLYGFRRADGTVIAPNRYSFVDHFNGNYCKVYLEDTLCGMIDRDGNEIVPCIYEDLEYPSDGRIKAYRKGLHGYLDLHGNVVIPLQYPQSGRFTQGLAPIAVYLDSFTVACTFIDTMGNEVFPRIFENVMPFCEGYDPVRRYDSWVMIDLSGREVLTTNPDGHFFAGDSEGWALFDYSMMPLTPFVYRNVGNFSDGRVSVSRDGKYGFLDGRGREVIPCIYDYVGGFQMGRAMVSLNDRYGIIDTNGRIILPIEYEYTSMKGFKYSYYDSLALVEKNGRLGYVDLDGNLAIPFYFEEAFHFTEGLAAVRFDGQWGYIDTHGDIFVPFIFEYASPLSWGRAEVVYLGNVSNMDRRGRCVRNCKGVIAWRDL